MINPYTSAVLDGDGVVADNLADCKVAEDNVGRVGDRDTCASDLGALANTNN